MRVDPAAKTFTPPAPVGLRPGQLVRVRSKNEIAKTLGPDGKTRGLWFDREMLAFCEQTFRVKAKIERFVDEATGKLVTLKTDCYSLENVVCSGDASPGRHLCSRAIYPWWRECWLEPVNDVMPRVNPSHFEPRKVNRRLDTINRRAGSTHPR
jgi:hypothetical protein